jgi:hypothetical protein
MRDEEALVTIAVFDTLWEASIARGALETAGIRALVPEERIGRLSRSGSIFASGSLQVLESDKDRAVAELRRRQIRIFEPPTQSDCD